MVEVESLGVELCKPPEPDRPNVVYLTGRPWRLNLTALSDDFNLYFAVVISDVVVFEPEFPTQKLNLPRLVIRTPPSRPGLRGYNDPIYPHAINQLLLQRFGADEVIVAVRDDGDVDAYLVRHIVHAIAQRRSRFNAFSVMANELRPLLHRNVGISAWGVAIHTEARLIAVSSNNHEFHVFSFGLVEQNYTSDVAAEYEITEREHRRIHDEHFQLANGDANIPAVSFCNTGHDPVGRYLLTTDISGLTRYWDLHTKQGPQGVYIGRTPRLNQEFHRLSAGWGVSFLDPRSFVEVDDFEMKAFGEHCREKSDWDKTGTVWDLTAARLNERIHQHPRTTPFSSTSRSSHSHRALPARRTAAGAGNISTEDPVPAVDVVDWDHARMAVERLDSVRLRIGGADDNHTDTSSTDDEREESAVDDDDANMDILEQIRHDFGDFESTAMDILPFDREPHVPAPRHRRRMELQFMRRLLADDSPERSPPPIDQDLHITFANPSTLCPTLPCPIFISSVKDVYLLQPSRTITPSPPLPPPPAPLPTGSSTSDQPLPQTTPSAPSPAPALSHLPLILYTDPFRPPHPLDQDPDLDAFDRASLLAQIPSLGILLVGNQRGRVTVFSGFKTRGKTNPDASVPPPPQPRRGGTLSNSSSSSSRRRVGVGVGVGVGDADGAADKVVYGLRFETTLPLPAQEREGLRPKTPLYGLSVGRMQGLQGGGSSSSAAAGGAGPERWRVLCMWLDETVMSYEIRRAGRRKSRSSEGDDDDDVVVEDGVSGLETLVI